jgi:hypothetical protein
MRQGKVTSGKDDHWIIGALEALRMIQITNFQFLTYFGLWIDTHAEDCKGSLPNPEYLLLTTDS